MRRPISALLLFGLATSCQDRPSTAPTAAPTITTATATAAGATTAVLEPTASCAPWAPSPRTLVARSGGGRGDFFREYQYDFESGVLGVHDSDPFADGKEAKDPRVTKKHKTLEPADKAQLAKALVAICPDDAAMSAFCAPGGCSRLVVKRGDGSETKVEHAKTVSQVMKLFRPHFPDLRGE
jgi:hypothetical protein